MFVKDSQGRGGLTDGDEFLSPLSTRKKISPHRFMVKRSRDSNAP